MTPLIVSYFTRGTPYEREIEHLRASLVRFGLEHHIDGVANRGNWNLNTHYKPRFIYEKMIEFQRPIIWLDADCVVMRDPALLYMIDSDFALHVLTRPPWHQIQNEWFTSVMYWDRSPQVLMALVKWAERCETNLDLHDQDHLQAMDPRTMGLTMFDLPLTYAKIFDWHQPVVNPAIVCNQASRRFKAVVNAV